MRAVLDACVLYPDVLREILAGCAARGLFTPLWSARILEEWRRAVIRSRPEQAGRVADEIAALAAAFPAATVPADPALEAGLALPDAADRHVLATAIAGGAALIVTLNLADFPRRTLARHGLHAAHPDAFLWDLAADRRDAVDASIAAAVDPLVASGAASGRRAVLKRARLPRLGRLLG